MSSTIFLIIALVTTGIFVIQFILSIFFGDIDADVDVDTDISSVVSFKGLTHFGIGFGWYMYLAGNTEIQTYAVAIFVGLCFVLAVWFLYKKAFQLQQVTVPNRQNSWSDANVRSTSSKMTADTPYRQNGMEPCAKWT